MSVAYYHSPELPWRSAEEDEQRFRRILKRLLLILLLFALVLPWLPLPELARDEIEEVPARLAKMILERPAPPLPPAPVEELKKPEPKAETPKKAETKKPEPDRTTRAREKAMQSGLLAARDELDDLRTDDMARKLDKTPGRTVGPGAAGTVDPNLIVADATRGSGGIGSARATDTGGGGLGGRKTTQVGGSPIGEGGGGGSVRRGGSGKASRSIEEIKLVLDRNKGSIYTIYNRALRADPTLQGKLVFELTIAPSGQVIECRIVSSELRAPDLERQIVARLKAFHFGAKDVDVTVARYWYDFVPS